MPCSERLNQGSPVDRHQYDVSQARHALTPPLPSTNQQVAAQAILHVPPSATSAKCHHETPTKDKPGNAKKKSHTKGASKENTKPTTDAAATAIEEDEILAKTSRWTDDKKSKFFDWLLGPDGEARFKIHTKNPERIYRKVSTLYLIRYSITY
jgi:hypothetical protein